MNPEKDAESLAHYILTAVLGFSATRLEERVGRRTADYLVHSEPPVLVEVTTKSHSGDFERSMSHGKLAEEHRIHEPSSTIRRVIRAKRDQLESSLDLSPSEPFRVILLVPSGPFARDINKEVSATFLGRVGIRLSRKDDRPIEHPCYMFDRATCYDVPEVDGLILAQEGEMEILLNPASPRRASFRKSRFVEEFAPGILDVDEREAEGKAFTLYDYQGQRDKTPENDRERRAFLEAKYGIELALPLRWNSVSIGQNIRLDAILSKL